MKIIFRILFVGLFYGATTVGAYEADFGFKFSRLPSKSSKELRIVWWNILQGGKLAVEIEKKEKHNPLQANLDSLTLPSQKPDFLILGEYRSNEIKPEIDQMLRSRYRYALFFPYSNTYSNQGIFVLSDLEMRTFTQQLGWVDHTASLTEQKTYRDEWEEIFPPSKTVFERTFILISYEWNGKTHYLLPFHSVQPWMPLKASYPERVSKIYTAYEILTGTENPLFYQFKQFFSILNQICNPISHQILMIGDLNTPDSMFGLYPIGYRLLTHKLNDAFERGADYTFPAPSSVGTGLAPSNNKINEIRIDHALTSNTQNSKNALRLPLRGSDHFPITVTLSN